MPGRLGQFIVVNVLFAEQMRQKIFGGVRKHHARFTPVQFRIEKVVVQTFQIVFSAESGINKRVFS